MGHSVFVLEVPENPKELLDELLKTCVHFKPDCIMGMNHIGFDSKGKIANILSELEMPVLFWYLDDYRFIIGESSDQIFSNIIIFSFEKNNINHLKKIGFENVYYLPTATVLQPGRKHYDSKYSFLSNAVSFIGSTFEMTKNQWSRSSYTDFLSEINLEDYFSEKNKTIIEYIQQKQKKYFSTKSELYHYAGYVAAHATQFYRKKYLAGIKSEKVHVFGDEKWKKLGLNATLHESVDNINTAPNIFFSSAINLNISSCQLETTVNLRVFDIPAANGFLLTDWREGLAELFDSDDEIVFYKSIDEMNDKINFYLRNADLREKITNNAKKRILSEHLLEHRLERILTTAKSIFA